MSHLLFYLVPQVSLSSFGWDSATRPQHHCRSDNLGLRDSASLISPKGSMFSVRVGIACH